MLSSIVWSKAAGRKKKILPSRQYGSLYAAFAADFRLPFEQDVASG